MIEFDKCNFCKQYNGYETWCHHCKFDPSLERIKDMAREEKITVMEVIELMRFCEWLRVFDEC